MMSDEDRRLMAGEISQETALRIIDTKWWEGLEPRDLAEIQFGQRLLCVPLHILQLALEKALRRSVWTHEFMDMKALRQELRGERAAPTHEEQFLPLLEGGGME